MALRFSTGLKNALLGESGIDTGANGLRGVFKDGVINVYSGAQPASADDAVTGTLLGTVTVDGAAFTPGSPTGGLEFGAPASGVVAKSVAETWKFTGLAAGTAGWFRFVGNALDGGASSTSLPRIDGSIARTGGDLNLSNTTIAVGAPTTIDVFQLTMGNG